MLVHIDPVINSSLLIINNFDLKLSVKDYISSEKIDLTSETQSAALKLEITLHVK